MTATILPLPEEDTFNSNDEPPDGGLYDGSVDALIASTRQLWNTRPVIRPNQREDLLVELIDLDLALERLSMRARSSSLDDADIKEITACSYRLGRLRRYWAATET